MTQFSTYAAIETLRDGRSVEIRAIRPDDRTALLEAISRASPKSLFRRFFAPRQKLTNQELDYFLNVDFVNHVALVAVAIESAKRVIVGGGRFIVVQPGRAEVAFAVIDPYQRQGLGTILMRHLGSMARAAGLRELIADVLIENSPMLKVFEHSGYPMMRTSGTDTVHVKLDLEGHP
jgi:GNAT superfamily N-acetyltransferase